MLSTNIFNFIIFISLNIVSIGFVVCYIFRGLMCLHIWFLSIFLFILLFFVRLFCYTVSYLCQQMYLGGNKWIIWDSRFSIFLHGGYQSGATSKQHAEVPWTFRHVGSGADASCLTHLYFERVDLSGSRLWEWVFYRIPALLSALAFDLALSLHRAIKIKV